MLHFDFCSIKFRSMSDSSHGKRRRSPEEPRRETRRKRKRSQSRRRENDSNQSSVNETLTKVFVGLDSMKKEFVAWTTRVSYIENQLNQNSSTCHQNTDEDCLSVHPSASPLTSDEVDRLSQDNSAIEAPLAGPEPPLADVRSDFNHTIVPKEGQDNHGLEQPCEFFDPENTALRKWAPSERFRTFLEKNLKRRLTVDQDHQVNKIIGKTPYLRQRHVLPLFWTNKF